MKFVVHSHHIRKNYTRCTKRMQIKKVKMIKRAAIREIKILLKVNHENVMTLYDAIDTPKQVLLSFLILFSST